MIALLLLLPPTSRACTVFCGRQENRVVVGKSLDWYQDHGAVIVNPRSLMKTAAFSDPSVIPIQWVSQYGSVTVNQVAREFPYGGVNEKGLMVEINQLVEAQNPIQDRSRPAVNEFQWVQFMLDRAANIDEVIARAQTIRIVPFFGKEHYFVCDARGECAVIEYLQGQLAVYRGRDLRVPVLTNDTYARSVWYLGFFQGFGGLSPIPTDPSSLSRFVRAAAGLQAINSAGDSVEESFHLLSRLENQGMSRWNLVYQLSNPALSFRTQKEKRIRSVGLNELDYHCEPDALGVDINGEGEGNIVSQLHRLSAKETSRLVEQTLGITPGFQSFLKSYSKNNTWCVRVP